MLPTQTIVEQLISTIEQLPASLATKKPGVKGDDNPDMKLGAVEITKLAEILAILIDRVPVIAQWLAALPQPDADGRYLARVMPLYAPEAVLPGITTVMQNIRNYSGAGTYAVCFVDGVLTALPPSTTATATPTTGGGTVTPTVTRNTDVTKVSTTTGEHPTSVDGLVSDANVITSQDKDTWAVFAAIPANQAGRVRFTITGLTQPLSFGSLNVGLSEKPDRPASASHNGGQEEARVNMDLSTRIGLVVEAQVNKEAHLYNTLADAGRGWFEYLNNVLVENGDIFEIAVNVGSYDYTLTKGASGVIMAGNFDSFENTNTRDGSKPAYLHIMGFNQGYAIKDLVLTRFGAIAS